VETNGFRTTERLWRQWRPNVIHNHTRERLDDLFGDSDGWLERMAANARAVLSAVGQNIDCSIVNIAAWLLPACLALLC
jgi:hypothetical protein